MSEGKRVCEVAGGPTRGTVVQARFSELTLDMYRMAQALELDLSVLAQPPHAMVRHIPLLQHSAAAFGMR